MKLREDSELEREEAAEKAQGRWDIVSHQGREVKSLEKVGTMAGTGWLPWLHLPTLLWIRGHESLVFC